MIRHVYFTPDGLERLQARIRETRATYQAVCDDNPAALESGDTSGWHDNFAFEENQRQMDYLARRVRELERLLSRSEVIPFLEDAPELVLLGATVTFWFEDEDDERTVWLVGYEDGDPKSRRVSYNSPLGAALVGARVGDTREMRVGERVRHLEIVEIGPSPEEVRCAAG